MEHKEKKSKKHIDYEDASLFGPEEFGQPNGADVPADTSSSDKSICRSKKCSTKHDANSKNQRTDEAQTTHEDINSKIAFVISKVVDSFYNTAKASSNFGVIAQIDKYEKFFKIITNLKQSLQKAKENNQIDEFLLDILNKLDID